MRSDYYVYVYLDPTKKGIWECKNFKFEYEPFYIGKGINNRLTRHMRNALTLSKYKNSYFHNKLRKMHSNNIKPLILKIRENLTSEDAYLIESELIRGIGRKYENGPLTNLQAEKSGINAHSPETRKKMSESAKKRPKRKLSKESRQNISKSRKGMKLTNKHKENISKKCKEKWKNIEYRNKVINNRLGKNVKSIVQLTKDNKFVKEWPSIKEASNVLNINRSNISAVCSNKNKNKKSAGGYKWIYASEYRK